MKALIILVLIIFTFFSCSSTMINTRPQGANIYLNKEYVGKTPYKHTDGKVLWSDTHFTLKKEGYKPVDLTITRNEEFHVTACILGVLFLVPLLWCREYKAERTIELEKIEEKK